MPLQWPRGVRSHLALLAGVTIGLLLPSAAAAQRQPRRVFVSVVDPVGKPVPNLAAGDFIVSENRVPREVRRAAADVPMRIALLVDSSSAISPLLTHFRSGLTSFLEVLPQQHEVTLISTGGQIRIRVPPTTDRQRLGTAAASFASDSGANSVIDTLLEVDRRFLKNAPDRWPVLIFVTTDAGVARGEPPIDEFNAMVADYRLRGGSAHAVIIRGSQTGVITDVLTNLVQNMGGLLETMNISNALGDKMAALAARIASDHSAMAGRYELEYVSDAKAPLGGIEVRVSRDDARLVLSARRPF